MSRRNKVLAYVFSIIAFGSGLLLYFEASLKGFPDGHLTELDRADKPLFFISCFLLIISGLFLIFLARFNQWRNRDKIFYRFIIGLFAIILIAITFDGYFISTLENGGGG